MRALLSTILFALLALAAPAAHGQQPADHTLQRPDLALFYSISGTGQPIVLLAGGPGLASGSYRPP